MESYRTERDFAGEVPVPTTMLYGAQTHRAVESFPISGLRFPHRFIRILGAIKQEVAPQGTVVMLHALPPKAIAASSPAIWVAPLVGPESLATLPLTSDDQ